MSVGNGMLDSMKGNKMNKSELLETIGEIQTAQLVELVEVKTGLETLGAYAYALSLFWNLSDNKLKAKIVSLIEEAN